MSRVDIDQHAGLAVTAGCGQHSIELVLEAAPIEDSGQRVSPCQPFEVSNSGFLITEAPLGLACRLEGLARRFPRMFGQGPRNRRARHGQAG